MEKKSLKELIKERLTELNNYLREFEGIKTDHHNRKNYSDYYHAKKQKKLNENILKDLKSSNVHNS
jgi:hypothetical protein